MSSSNASKPEPPGDAALLPERVISGMIERTGPPRTDPNWGGFTQSRKLIRRHHNCSTITSIAFRRSGALKSGSHAPL